jgi:hypothetical protein
MRYYPAVGPAIPRVSVGRSRVTHPFAGHPLRGAHDLHVLSTPPAFVLSQDQTLQEKSSKQLFRTPLLAINRSRSHSQSRQLRQESQIDCRSNSPRHPDMDARSTSPPCTSAISSSVVKQQRLINTFGAAFSGSLTTYPAFASKSTGNAGDFDGATPRPHHAAPAAHRTTYAYH